MAESVHDCNQKPDSVWAIADAWFAARDLVCEFRHLINATQTLEFYGGLGNLLDEIRRPESLVLLGAWRQTSSAANALFRLGASVNGNESPGFPHEFSSYSDTRSARTHLGKSLGRCYLIALFITRYPDGNRESIWLSRLRLWLLTHAYQRSLSESVLLDVHHRKMADALRICCESISRGQASHWLPVFRALLTSIIEWSALNSHLHGLANALREKKAFEDAGCELLKAISAITSGEVAPIEGPSVLPIWRVPSSTKTDIRSSKIFIDDDEQLNFGYI